MVKLRGAFLYVIVKKPPNIIKVFSVKYQENVVTVSEAPLNKSKMMLECVFANIDMPDFGVETRLYRGATYTPTELGIFPNKNTHFL